MTAHNCNGCLSNEVMVFKLKSIASRIFLSVIPVTVISTILFISMIYFVSHQQINDQINERMTESVKVAGLDIQAELLKNSNVARNLAVFAGNAHIPSMPEENFNEFVRKSIDSNKNTVAGGIWYRPYGFDYAKRYYSAFAYREGDEIFVTSDYADSVDYHTEGWYLHSVVAAPGKISWSDIIIDPVTGVPLISASVPFYNEYGSVQGVTTADMALTSIREITNSIKVGKTGHAFLVGKYGEYLSYFDDSHKSPDKIQNDVNDTLASLGRDLLKTPTGTTEIILNGSKLSVYFDTLPDVDWKLVMLIDSSEIRSSTLSMVLMMSIIPILGLLLTVICIVLVVRHLLRVVTKVNRFADMAASGNLSERIDILEYDEFGVMEDRLNQMIAKMSEMSTQTEEMLIVAQTANRAKDDFLSRMSHEIRTPINAISGMTHIASNTADPTVVEDCLGKIAHASGTLMSMVNALFDVSQMSSTELVLANDSFDLISLLKSIRDLAKLHTQQSGQNFLFSLTGDDVHHVIGDELRLAQIMTNLLSNSIKFTPEGGEIRLDVQCQKTEAGIDFSATVTDTGVGISKQHQAHLFTSFEQADGGHARKYGGIGLGLAMTKTIVERMGGTIWVESDEGHGSTFGFTCPLGLSEAPEAKVSTGEKSASIPDWSDKLFLLAEDIEINREITCALLEETGVTIHCAQNGLEAVELFKQKEARYDLILMDIQMPEMDGFETTRTIRALSSGKTLPILALTANSLPTDIEQSLASGMNDHIPKPIDPELLIKKIREYLGA